MKKLTPLDIHLQITGLERLKLRLGNQVLNTSLKADQTLSISLEAQKRTELLKKYPQLEGKVRITNEKIIVTTTAGELTFGFTHTEGGQTFQNAHKPYSKEQLQALVNLFGNKPAPYLDILGLKNTHVDNGNTYGYNFYWSSSTHNTNYAWGLDLFAGVVGVDYYNQGLSFSAIVS